MRSAFAAEVHLRRLAFDGRLYLEELAPFEVEHGGQDVRREHFAAVVELADVPVVEPPRRLDAVLRLRELSLEGEKILIRSELTDENGVPIDFSTLTSVACVVEDILGNKVTPDVVAGNTLTSLQYEVETATLREGVITSQLDIVYPTSDFSGSTNTDIVVEEIFTLYPLL